MRPSMRTTIAALLVLVVTFLGGLVSGVVADRLFLLSEGRIYPREGLDAMVEHLPDRLDRKLDLEERQKVEVERIVARHRTEIERHWETVAPAIRQELTVAREEIERILDDEQRQKFQEMSERWERWAGK